MNPVLNEPPHWSRARWTLAVLGVFGAHLGLLLGLSAPKRKPLQPSGAAPRVTLLMDAEANQRWLHATRVDDPTVFAVANAQGFSRKVWQGARDSSVTPLTWSSDPRFLRPAIDHFGQAFGAAAGSPPNPEEFSSERRIPELQLAVEEDVDAFRSSRVELSANLRDRGPTRMPEAPVLASEESLRVTVVEVDVDLHGAVFSCRLSHQGRLPTEMPVQNTTAALQRQADALALEYARKLRFRPAGGEGNLAGDGLKLTSGRLRFEWGYAPAPPAEPPVEQ